MSMSHPPSRLSPPPGTAVSDIIDSAVGAPSDGASGSGGMGRGSIEPSPFSGKDKERDGDDGAGEKDKDNKDRDRDRDGRRGDAPKRGYRACVHCRLRKARCDLGDVNAPSEPPCSRCRREQRNCVFLPSKRRKKNPAESEESALLAALEAAGGDITSYTTQASSNHLGGPSRPSASGSLDSRRMSSTQQLRGGHVFPTTGLPQNVPVPHQQHRPLPHEASQHHLHQLHQQHLQRAAQQMGAHGHSVSPPVPMSHEQVKSDWEMNMMGQSQSSGGQMYQGWNDTLASNLFDRSGSGSLFPFPDSRAQGDVKPVLPQTLTQLHQQYSTSDFQVPQTQTQQRVTSGSTSNTNQTSQISPMHNQHVSFDFSSLSGPPSNPTSGGPPSGPSGSGPGGTASLGAQPTLTPQSVDSTSTSALSPNTRSKRRREGGPDATRRLVVANFSNETDALEILAHAATDEDGKEGDSSGGEGERVVAPGGERRVKGKKVAWKDNEEKGLEDFVLIRLGIVDEATLWGMVAFYFDHHHPVLPIIQTPRIPRSPAQLPRFASNDPFLLAVIVAIASRYHADPRIQKVHSDTWALVREVLSDYTLSGIQANVGLVEGALLLAEFLPRELSTPDSPNGARRANTLSLLGRHDPIPGRVGEPAFSGGGLHGTENRRSWALTGLAIRAAYGMQLDEVALELNGPRTIEAERARLAWTWCYLYDRTIGLRTGLAFWSRGPTLCFTGYSHISQTGEAAARVHFPSMLSPTPQESYAQDAPKVAEGGGERASDDPAFTPEQEARIRGAGADSASLIQALTELTQLMTNAHDTLYPNRMRTSDLVKKGAYFRHLDSFSRGLDAFKAVWHDRVWQAEHLKELTWCTYEMVRLYVSSFAFQAHVQRAWARAEDEEKRRAEQAGETDGESGSGNGNGQGRSGSMTPGMTSVGLGVGIGAGGGAAKEGVHLFPRGSATSPDALYIYASIDAANEILNICLRLAAMGVLGYLPSRYLINFVFGGVFALKAGYSGAVGRAEIMKTRELVDRVCAALVLASPDREHPASRYGQMLRLLSRKLEELSDQSAVPSRYPSPEPGERGAGVGHNPHLPSSSNWEHLLMSHGTGTGNGGFRREGGIGGEYGMAGGGGGGGGIADATSAGASAGTLATTLAPEGVGMTPIHSQSGLQGVNHLTHEDGNGHGLGAGAEGGTGANGSGIGSVESGVINHHSNYEQLAAQMGLHIPPSSAAGVGGFMGHGHGMGGVGMGHHLGQQHLHQHQQQQQQHQQQHHQQQQQSHLQGLQPGHGQGHAQGQPGGAGMDGLFDFDVDVNFNMDGFWDDFTLAEGSGFPFR